MNDTMKKYIHSKINDDFGLSVDDVAKHVGGYGRFNGWLGGNQTKIKEVLNAVKNAGVSPAFFASYECGEGYNSAWGWLNHTSPQGNPVEDAKAVCAWIKSQANKTAEPAWIDYANYKDFVPASVKAEGNTDAKNLPSSSIGRIVISGTAAATWEVYYPNGLNASYNGVQNYGAPITEQYKRILAWGGKIDGKGGSSSDGSDSGGSDSGGSTSGGFDPMAMIKKAFDSFLKSIQDAMTWDLHSVGAEKFFTNQMFALQKTYNNTYRLQMNTPMLNKLNDLKNSIDTGSNGTSNGGNSDDDDKDDNSGASSGKSVKPNGKSGKRIGGNWTYETLPQKYKDAIDVPLFDTKYLAGSPFVNTGDKGQCTELTWAYMHQLWGKTQPAWDNQVTNGQRVWEVYKAKGAKTTHSPTVKYGFSSKPPYLEASLVGVGHTGVVVAVFDDGSFLTANYNVSPYWAPSRVVEYALIDGVPENAGSNIVFFSGIA